MPFSIVERRLLRLTPINFILDAVPSQSHVVRPYFHAGLLSLTVQASHMGLRAKIGAGHVRLVSSCHHQCFAQGFAFI